MNKTISLGVIALLGSGLAAQGLKTTLKTATPNGYAVLATAGSTTKSEGIKNDTEITRARRISASASMTTRASTSLGKTSSWWWGTGAYVSEFGSTANDRNGNGGGSCGTGEGDDTKATAGAHTVTLHFDVAENKEAEITVSFSGYARGDGSSSTSVDVDGDSNADFTAKTDTTSRRGVHKTGKFKVKAGKNGITVTITTEGAARLGSNGERAHYSASTRVYAKGPAATITCTATPYGAECGGKLTASSSTVFNQRLVKLSLTGAAKDAVGFMVFGARKVSVPLPASSCKLLNEAAGLIPIRTNSSGESTHYLRTSLTTQGALMVQDVILEFGPKGLDITSSNGLEIVCKKQ